MYDVIILGAGPAGLTAGIFTARYKLNTLIIGQEIGGTANKALKVENYPGFKSINGVELMEKFKDHLAEYKVRVKIEEIKGIVKDKNKKIFDVKTREASYLAKSIIVALGTKRRQLNIPGEKEFLGKRVSYCAVCDAPLCKNKTVAVIGHTDPAASTALFLSDYAKKVYFICEKEKLEAQPLKLEQIEKNQKIEFINQAKIKEIKGKNFLESIILDVQEETKKSSKELDLDFLFIEADVVPIIGIVKGLGIEIDDRELIITDEYCKTNIPGIFAAGDITTTSGALKQIITAAAEGAVAATSVYNYIGEKRI